MGKMLLPNYKNIVSDFGMFSFTQSFNYVYRVMAIGLKFSSPSNVIIKSDVTWPHLLVASIPALPSCCF